MLARTGCECSAVHWVGGGRAGHFQPPANSCIREWTPATDPPADMFKAASNPYDDIVGEWEVERSTVTSSPRLLRGVWRSCLTRC